MLSYVKLPKVIWGEALLTTNYLQNKSPTKVVTTNTTPYGLWFGRQPNLSYLRVFGCKTHVFIHKEKRQKLDSLSHECIFLEYNKKSKAYCLMYTHDRKTVISKDVIFNKSFATHREDQHLQKTVEEENGTPFNLISLTKTPPYKGNRHLQVKMLQMDSHLHMSNLHFQLHDLYRFNQ
jgi:hypothetical protein